MLPPDPDLRIAQGKGAGSSPASERSVEPAPLLVKMRAMLNERLIRVIVNLLAFLEFSEEEQVDPDVAVQHMEAAASILSGMSESEALEFNFVAQKMAEEEMVGGGGADRIAFFRNVGKYVGLDDEGGAG